MENRTDQDLVASELLYAFKLNRAVDISKTYLQRETRIYLKPVFVIQEDGTKSFEVIANSKPCIKIQD